MQTFAATHGWFAFELFQKLLKLYFLISITQIKFFLFTLKIKTHLAGKWENDENKPVITFFTLSKAAEMVEDELDRIRLELYESKSVQKLLASSFATINRNSGEKSDLEFLLGPWFFADHNEHLIFDSLGLGSEEEFSNISPNPWKILQTFYIQELYI